MVTNVFNKLMSIKSHNEIFFSDKIEIENRQLFLVYYDSLIYKDSNLIYSFDILPIAIISLEYENNNLVNSYFFLLDTYYLNFIETILIKFSLYYKKIK